MNKLPNHTTLKEWANVIDAIGEGRQIILIRKGGLADPKFGVEAERFYLYPTYFHQGEQDPRTTVEVTHWAEVVKTWSVRDLEVLGRLEPFVVMPRDTLVTRYKFRPDQALHIIAVRGWKLPQPVTVRYADAYGGCVSWISVDDEIDVTGSASVLSEDELTRKIAEIDAAVTPVASGERRL